MMMRTMAIAIMKIVDIAIIRAVARCPCPERSAGIKKKMKEQLLGSENS